VTPASTGSVFKAYMNSIDEIIELYKRDVDTTLIDASLRRTVEERIRALEEFERFREELQAATERKRDAIR
jgi:hypothetical protein